MKKILISARDLKIGGIEKSLINLLNYFSEKKYKLTLVLERKEGKLLEKVPKDVRIILYNPISNKNKIIRKSINFFKRILFIVNYGKRFNISISFATYLESGSFVARVASNNSCLWCHADYLELFRGDRNKVKSFFENLQYEKFTKIVFVSNAGKESFLKVFPKKENVYVCNNLIDYNEIYKKTEEKISVKYDEENITFLNVGRHDEEQKKLSRIIEAANILKEEGLNFKIIFVGEGQATKFYKDEVQRLKLEKNIIFVGEKTNPYPYFKISDCIILSSDYEGYPVVFLESFILNKPIITTNVSDYEEVVEGRGIVVQKNTKELCNAMRNFIKNGYKLKSQFDVVKYNEEVKKRINLIVM